MAIDAFSKLFQDQEIIDQDFVIMNGFRNPGKATITSGAFVKKYDVVNAYGAHGGNAHLRG